ncbi:PAS domain-containing protein [Halorientalis brevis]|uniref:histidine kinase n=1 Tax=Halorientalis brevis TaxID=1126241 RepID=A0ABD6C8J5_9EURY|nr:PAS domain-containing sensor histidine kinase [Halorientalis brevis]
MDADGPTEEQRISATIRDVNRGLVESESLGELETTVCAVFADADPYVFAWIGEYDAECGEVVPSTAAGVGEDYCDDLVISVREGPASRGPTATAVRTGEIQAIQNIHDDPDYEPWREEALARGYESSAAVPLVCDGRACRVLNLYTDRPDAFSDAERELLAELGETIANAIAGIEARNELQSQKEKYEQLTERISDAYYAVDTDWTITYWNDKMAERTGVAEAEVLGETLWTVFPEVRGTETAAHYRTAMETSEPASFETFLDDPFGYWVTVEVYPDANGLSIFSREITERKEYERRLEAIIENTTNPIYLKNRDGEYQLLNDAAASLFGLDPADAVGLTDDDLFDAESAAAIKAHDSEIVASGQSETGETVRHIGGREHVFIDNKFPYRDGAGNVVGVMGISHDITGRKARERDLRETKRWLDLALDATDTGVWEQDLDTNTSTWNESMEQLFGLDPNTFNGSYEDFIDLVHPDDVPEIARAHRRAIESGDLYEAEFRIQPDEETERWVEARGQVVTTDEGQGRMIGIVTDVTDRKTRERRLQEQNERLEVLNRIVRHDIRNDMQLVVSLSELLAARTDDETLTDYADQILDHADHVVELTQIARDLMETILQDGTNREPTLLARTLETQLDDLQSAYDHVLVETTTPIPRTAVYADEMLNSVFRNLLKNAVQHNDSDRPEIEVSVTESDSTVTVHVADNGPGIPAGQTESIFGKGTKGLDSDGTGIGLYLVNSLVESYGGEVWIDANDRDGATFNVRLETVDGD